MPTFYVIDGSGYMYRAYYGLPELTNKDGQNINLIFGFLKMILRLLMDKPDYFLIARDLPKRTIRHEKFAEYKANRTKAPDDFKQQIPRLQEIVRNIGLPSLGVEGYEADDVIATFANIASKSNIHTTIFSGDKDMKQILDENIIFKDPMKNKITKYKDFLEEFGFEPKHIVDYLALIGDSSDNIPGIVGIGPKTAITLIKDYKTVENIYSNIDKISPKTKEKLILGKESALYSKELILLMEVPNLDLNIAKYNIDLTKLRKFIVHHMGFNSFDKIINELEHKISMPTEVGLFG